MHRRDLLTYALTCGTGGLLLSLLPIPLTAQVKQTLASVYGTRPIESGRVQLKIPALAENGHSVALTVTVQSPMTAADYVSEIRIFAPKNPVPQLARYQLYPGTGKAAVSSRIRLSDTQVITAVAAMHDGSLWAGSTETIVTLAACIEPLL